LPAGIPRSSTLRSDSLTLPRPLDPVNRRADQGPNTGSPNPRGLGETLGGVHEGLNK